MSEKTLKVRDFPKTTIRMSPEQYFKISEISKESRKTIPKVFLDLLDKKAPLVTLMNTENVEKIKIELNRIGNNINQIARKVNSGEIVLSQSFDDFRDQLNLIYGFLARSNGIR